MTDYLTSAGPSSLPFPKMFFKVVHTKKFCLKNGVKLKQISKAALSLQILLNQYNIQQNW